MKSLTINDIMDLKPCYSRAKVESVFNGRESLTLAEILAADIPPEDRIWVLIQPGVMTPEQVKAFCDRTADRAVRNHCLNSGIKAVEEWAAKWLNGEDRTAEAAMAANSAARAAEAAMAADSATNWAAYWAARAAYSAADWAAEAAHWAAHSAANSAARAAQAAEREAQVADLLEIIA
jgi:predicted kinase